MKAFILFLYCAATLHGAQTYGVIRPTKHLPATGILHFKEENGLEIQGYVSGIKKPLVIALWSSKPSTSSYICAGALDAKKLPSLSIPVQEKHILGHSVIHANHYGEISLFLDQMHLKDLENAQLLIYPAGEKELKVSENLIDSQFAPLHLMPAVIY